MSHTSATGKIDTFILSTNPGSPSIASTFCKQCPPFHTSYYHPRPRPPLTHTNRKIIPSSGLTPTHIPTTYIKRPRPLSQHSRPPGENQSLQDRMVWSFSLSSKPANSTFEKKKQPYGFSSTILILNHQRRPNLSWTLLVAILACMSRIRILSLQVM